MPALPIEEKIITIDGEVVGLQEIEKRLEELERAKKELEERDRRKDEFLAVLSHEIRTPLGAVMNWVEVLRGDSVDRSTIEHALGAIERSVKLQARMIDDLLDISRIIAGKLSLELQDSDLVTTIRAAIDLVLPVAEQKEVSLEYQIEPESADVRGDSTRLQQVIANLLSNAVKFTPAKGKIRIELACPDDHAEIRVRDSGEGIAPEFLPDIFDRFSQGTSRARRSSGLGLGLSIAKHLVELHGGTIDAESPGQGLGSTFRVRIPLRGAPASAGDSASGSAEVVERGEHGLSDVKVLIVDDDADTALALVTLLQREGAVVQDVRSVSEALSAFRRQRPEIVLTDLTMRDGDGYQLIAALREIEKQTNHSKPAPVVALTGSARGEDRRRVIAAGFALHLTKPVEPAEVVTAVAMCAQGRAPEFAEARRKRAPLGKRAGQLDRITSSRPPVGRSSRPSTD